MLDFFVATLRDGKKVFLEKKNFLFLPDFLEPLLLIAGKKSIFFSQSVFAYEHCSC